MLAQSDAVDEIEVGIENLLRSVSAEHADEQCHNALHYQCVALCGEPQCPVTVVGLQPHTTLAAVDEVAFGFILVVQRLLFVAEVDEQLVFVHPVFEVRELLNNFVLQFVYIFHVLVS